MITQCDEQCGVGSGENKFFLIFERFVVVVMDEGGGFKRNLR